MSSSMKNIIILNIKYKRKLQTVKSVSLTNI